MTGEQIANTTLQQIGGAGKISAMIGANRIAFNSEGTLTFHFKGSRKMNFIKIKLNSSDLYEVEFYKYSPRKNELKEITTKTDVFSENLKSIIETETDLYLSL